MSPQTLARRTAFSLVEAMLATVLTTIAGGALLASLASSVSTSDDIALRTLGRALASDLMDEIAAARFPIPDQEASLRTFFSTVPDEPRATVVAVGKTVVSTRPSRLGYLTLDDYSGWTSSPPTTREGYPLGTDGVIRSGVMTRNPLLQPDGRIVARITRRVIVEALTESNGDLIPAATATAAHRRVVVIVEYTNASGAKKEIARATRVFSLIPNELP